MSDNLTDSDYEAMDNYFSHSKYAGKNIGPELKPNSVENEFRAVMLDAVPVDVLTKILTIMEIDHSGTAEIDSQIYDLLMDSMNSGGIPRDRFSSVMSATQNFLNQKPRPIVTLHAEIE